MRTWPALRVSGLAARASVDQPLVDLVQAALSDYPVAAIEEISEDEWRVFFAATGERLDAAQALVAQFPDLHIEDAEIPDEDWATRSQASLKAIRAGGLIVAPPWDVPGDAGVKTIIIQPSMGFGTGHHATTRLCLEALQARSLQQRSLADIGTGSGVLAIAASILGAKPVVALDDDPDAVQCAVENLALNPGADVEFAVTDLRAFERTGFDVVTANLTGGLLMATATRLEHLVKPGGTLILSGIMASEATDVLACFTFCRLHHRMEADEWVCVTLERRDEP